MGLRIGRFICVTLLAMAIAMLPLSGGFATAAPASAQVTAVSARAMPDCNHHQHQYGSPSEQTQKTFDHNTCITGCALCFGFVGTNAAEIVYAMPASTTLAPAHAGDDFSSLMGSPPFRPPRA